VVNVRLMSGTNALHGDEVLRSCRVTAAHGQVSAVPDRVQWRCEPWATQVACPRVVLETIRREAVDGFARLPHGGLEVGGIPFGRRTEQSIEIQGALAVRVRTQTRTVI
jgi:hypothetical protein